MFGEIGFLELLVIMIVILIVFGPSKIPELARGIGKAIKTLKSMAEDVKHELKMNDWDK